MAFGRQVECHVLSNIVPSKHYQFELLLGQRVQINTRAEIIYYTLVVII